MKMSLMLLLVAFAGARALNAQPQQATIAEGGDEAFVRFQQAVQAHDGKGDWLAIQSALSVLDFDGLQAALAEAADLRDRRLGVFVMESASLAMAARDPEAAVRWIHREADPELRYTLENVAMEQWARFDPKAAFEWTQTLPNDAPPLNNLSATALAGLALTNPERAWELAEGLTPENTQAKRNVFEV